MGAETKIAWTDHTFNPWWGCARVSPGCEHCYAETFAKRTGHNVWGVQNERRRFGDKHWNEPLAWNAAALKAGVRRRVFCASMADVFEDRRDLDAERLRLWALIDVTPALDWLLLTKRPENLRKFLPSTTSIPPRPNVWLGTTCENQARADERIPHLLDVPAAVRFLSCEPMLEGVDLGDALDEQGFEGAAGWMQTREHGIDWVIVGGESGPKARPFDLAWARNIVGRCCDAGVACFMKQLGARPVRTFCASGLKCTHPDCGPETLALADRAGADPSEWPADLRVREFPAVRS